MLRGICKRQTVAAIALGFLGLAGQAKGTLITVEVTGTVSVIYELNGFEFDGSIEMGVPMVGRCTYDSDAPDQSPGPYGGRYAVMSVSLEVGDYLFYNDPLAARQPVFDVFLSDGGGYLVDSPDSRFDGTIYVNGSPKVFDEVEFDYTHMFLMDLLASEPGYILDDSLPTSFPPISIFGSRKAWSVSALTGPAGWLSTGGEITDIRVVPEPASLLLLAFGVGLLRRKT